MNEKTNSAGVLIKKDPAVENFLKTLHDFKRLVGGYDYNIRTYSEPSLRRFLTFSQEMQSKVMNEFGGFYHFLAESSHEGLNLRDNGLLLEKFLKKFGFIYDPSMFDQIDKRDVVEIYTKDFVQIYRNLVFMELCSYSLMELLTYDPYELYERSHQVKQLMIQEISQLVTRPFDISPIDVRHLPRHAIREKFSEEKLTSLVKFKKVFPLYTWPQEFAAFVVIQEGENIKELPAEISFL